MHGSNKLNTPIWVSLVEDNRFIREGWTETLKGVEDFQIIGSFGSCEEAFVNPSFNDSEVILMDIGLPGMSGIDGVKKIKEANIDAAIVICTVYEDDQKIFDALCAGAIGYLVKEVNPPELIQAVRDAAAGGSPMTPNIARKVIATLQKPKPEEAPEHNLTDREKEVLVMLAEGKSYPTIAQQLYLSVDGVVSRIRNIYMKLQAHSRAEAVAKGLARGIIAPPSNV